MRSKLESAKGDTFSGTIITDFLYGATDGSDLRGALDEIRYYNILRTWDSSQWAELLKRCVICLLHCVMLRGITRYFVDQPYTVVIGRPSANLAEKLETIEKARLAAQVERLGHEGLAKAEQELDAAKAEHELPIPKEILTSFPVPDVRSIPWIPVKSVQELGKGRSVASIPSLQSDLEKHIESDGEPLSMFVQYDHVKVSFFSS